MASPCNCLRHQPPVESIHFSFRHLASAKKLTVKELESRSTRSTTTFVGPLLAFVSEDPLSLSHAIANVSTVKRDLTDAQTAKFQYTFFDAYGRNTTPPEPITPFPTLFTAPVYRPTTNTMELTISNFFYDDPKTNQPAPLEVWLGDIGPLRYRIYQAVPTGPLQPFQVPRSGLEDSPPPPGQQALGEMPGTPISPVSDRSLAGALPAIPPRHYNAGPAHTIVIVEMPTVGEIISSIGETVPPQGDDAESASPESGMTPRHDPATLGPLLARGLPIFFIRPYDGTGYHAGRSVACENIFQTLNIGGDGAVNQAWIAAAQAAQHDGTAHGWTLRVV